jgi:flagellar hook-basal body complex protein FliE
MPSEIQYNLIAPSGDVDARPEPRGIPATGETGGAGFSKQLGGAIQQLDQLHVEADEQANAIANGGGNLHEVALAFEKADVAMRLATKVRNKLVEAYNEVMRMSI